MYQDIINIHYSLPSGIICPHCKIRSNDRDYETTSIPTGHIKDYFDEVEAPYERGKMLRCPVCNKLTVLIDDKIVYPNNLPIEPNNDMPEDVKAIFIEALSIANKSPRAACALLRLCTEKLCLHLGANQHKNLAEKIKEISTNPDVINLLEACRIAGNKAVHPALVDITENDVILVKNLAKFINLVITTTITTQRLAEDIKNRFTPKDRAN